MTAYTEERLREIKGAELEKTAAKAAKPTKKERSRKGRALSVAIRKFEQARARLVAALDDAGLTVELLADLRKLQGFSDVAEKFSGRAP